MPEQMVLSAPGQVFFIGAAAGAGDGKADDIDLFISSKAQS